MSEENFVGYVGDYRVHDSEIKEIISDGDIALVSLISEENETIKVKFSGVKSISSNRPIGITLYALSELKEQPPFRKFVFLNTNNEDDSLEVIAQDYIFNY